MQLPEKGCLLRIHIGEKNRHEGKPLYSWIVHKAREAGMAGATVLRGMMGYGASSRIKTASILSISEDLPIIIELVDTQEQLEQFLHLIEPVIGEGLTTMEKVNIHFYRSGG